MKSLCMTITFIFLLFHSPANAYILPSEGDTVRAQGSIFVLRAGHLTRTTVEADKDEMMRVGCLHNSLFECKSSVCGVKVEHYPDAVFYNSQNSSLVSGGIHRVMVDDDNSMWACNVGGDLSVFDGRGWKTIEKLCGKGKFHSCVKDSRMKSDRARFIVCNGVVDVDRKSLHVSRVLHVTSWANQNVKFEHPDTLSVRKFFAMSYCLSDNTYTMNDTYLRKRWRNVVDGSDVYDAKELLESLWLRDELTNGLPFDEQQIGGRSSWKDYVLDERNVDARDNLAHLLCTYYNGNVNSIASDRNGTVYIASNYGVAVLPSPEVAGVREQERSTLQFKITPNPAIVYANIAFQTDMPAGSHLSIIDINGRVVQSLAIDGRELRIGVSRLAAGAYQVAVTTPYARKSTTLVVK